MTRKYDVGVSGGVGLRVVFVTLSLLALGFAIFTLLQTFSSNKTDDMREAQRLSEYGLQEAFSKLAEHWDWGTEFEDEPFEEGGGKYRVEFLREERDGRIFLTITSTGTVGNTYQTRSQTLRQYINEFGTPAWINENEKDPTPAEETETDSTDLAEDTADNESETKLDN